MSELQPREHRDPMDYLTEPAARLFLRMQASGFTEFTTTQALGIALDKAIGRKLEKREIVFALAEGHSEDEIAERYDELIKARVPSLLVELQADEQARQTLEELLAKIDRKVILQDSVDQAA